MLVAALLVSGKPPGAAARESALDQIGPAVQEEIKAGRLPGAVVIVGSRDKVLYRRAFGLRSKGPPPEAMTADTVFDLASLTKVIVTTTAVMQLAETGRLKLSDPVAAHWPEFGQGGKSGITIRHLLTHTSGLRADLDFAIPWSGSGTARRMVEAEQPVHPPGSAFLYSDINFIALGMLVQKLTGQRLDLYAQRHIFAPLAMDRTGYRPSAGLVPRIAPTDRRDGAPRRGSVQDPTSDRMEGIAGHAGLFGTADDLARFARAMLNDGALGRRRILSRRSIAEMTAPHDIPGGYLRGLGWDMTSPFAGGQDQAFGPGSYGHTGYTGTSVWIDPRHDRYLVILASRLHPDGHGDARPLRAHLAQIVAGEASPVQSGLDSLERDHFAMLSGLRTALLTNRTGRDARGRRTIDVLRQAPGVRLVRIFTPEHGLGASAEGRIGGGRDGPSGLPVVSLYGAGFRPPPDSLSGLDAVVIDLQDAGVRFYTYPATMAYLMEAAAAAGVRVIVLDRPNPITAQAVEGPVSAPPYGRLTNYLALPVRHGMTLGELAHLFNDESGIHADLTVIPMTGYRRPLWYDQTGLAWTDPSPNLRSVEEAALYPGVGMIEGANVSVGRGTASPFELVGAPWVVAGDLKAELDGMAVPGVRFAETDFIPDRDAFAGRLCHGVQLAVTDRQAMNAPLLGVALAAGLARLYPGQFRLEDTGSLMGSADILAAIRSGASPQEIAGRWSAELQRFQQTRERHLLYP